MATVRGPVLKQLLGFLSSDNAVKRRIALNMVKAGTPNQQRDLVDAMVAQIVEATEPRESSTGPNPSTRRSARLSSNAVSRRVAARQAAASLGMVMNTLPQLARSVAAALLNNGSRTLLRLCECEALGPLLLVPLEGAAACPDVDKGTTPPSTLLELLCVAESIDFEEELVAFWESGTSQSPAESRMGALHAGEVLAIVGLSWGTSLQQEFIGASVLPLLAMNVAGRTFETRKALRFLLAAAEASSPINASSSWVTALCSHFPQLISAVANWLRHCGGTGGDDGRAVYSRAGSTGGSAAGGRPASASLTTIPLHAAHQRDVHDTMGTDIPHATQDAVRLCVSLATHFSAATGMLLGSVSSREMREASASAADLAASISALLDVLRTTPELAAGLAKSSQVLAGASPSQTVSASLLLAFAAIVNTASGGLTGGVLVAPSAATSGPLPSTTAIAHPPSVYRLNYRGIETRPECVFAESLLRVFAASFPAWMALAPHTGEGLIACIDSIMTLALRVRQFASGASFAGDSASDSLTGPLVIYDALVRRHLDAETLTTTFEFSAAILVAAIPRYLVAVADRSHRVKAEEATIALTLRPVLNILRLELIDRGRAGATGSDWTRRQLFGSLTHVLAQLVASDDGSVDLSRSIIGDAAEALRLSVESHTIGSEYVYNVFNALRRRIAERSATAILPISTIEYLVGSIVVTHARELLKGSREALLALVRDVMDAAEESTEAVSSTLYEALLDLRCAQFLPRGKIEELVHTLLRSVKQVAAKSSAEDRSLVGRLAAIRAAALSGNVQTFTWRTEVVPVSITVLQNSPSVQVRIQVLSLLTQMPVDDVESTQLKRLMRQLGCLVTPSNAAPVICAALSVAQHVVNRCSPFSAFAVAEAVIACILPGISRLLGSGTRMTNPVVDGLSSFLCTCFTAVEQARAGAVDTSRSPVVSQLENTARTAERVPLSPLLLVNALSIPMGFNFETHGSSSDAPNKTTDGAGSTSEGLDDGLGASSALYHESELEANFDTCASLVAAIATLSPALCTRMLNDLVATCRSPPEGVSVKGRRFVASVIAHIGERIDLDERIGARFCGEELPEGLLSIACKRSVAAQRRLLSLSNVPGKLVLDAVVRGALDFDDVVIRIVKGLVSLPTAPPKRVDETAWCEFLQCAMCSAPSADKLRSLVDQHFTPVFLDDDKNWLQILALQAVEALVACHEQQSTNQEQTVETTPARFRLRWLGSTADASQTSTATDDNLRLPSPAPLGAFFQAALGPGGAKSARQRTRALQLLCRLLKCPGTSSTMGVQLLVIVSLPALVTVVETHCTAAEAEEFYGTIGAARTPDGAPLADYLFSGTTL